MGLWQREPLPLDQIGSYVAGARTRTPEHPPPSNKLYSRAALRFYADLHLFVRAAQYDNIHGGVRAIGPQVLGRVGKATISAPVYGFGTAERKHVRKVFISTAHQKLSLIHI